ncbi:hypothetical protein PCASD_04300 [Puccinia coronata f. sp. avenae]|uniref:DUF1365 domain-containing protein n=1 Tax=Puccinia coronata f. sp. avenae TaxID=200324 RepID=A0A2N5VCU3_9BASI|nr:hypothetical protein PCASD_04300 [Puccinia coronata f. sp. avenae]
MSTSDLIVRSLIPISPKSITLLDLILPPILICLSIAIFDIQYYNKKLNKLVLLNSHLFNNQTQHARFIPKKHQFNYSLIQFGVHLDHLEQHELDIPHLFRYLNNNNNNNNNKQHQNTYHLNPFTWLLNTLHIFEIKPQSYFKSSSSTPPHSIKASLFNQLETLFHIPNPDHHIGKVYLISMPTYLGFTSINPLSIYFCYEKPEEPSKSARHPPLKYVILDVQNTFDERHSYLLTVGIDELTPSQSSEFQHEWIVPRAFHVSPFNDRKGSYKVSLSDPFSDTHPDQDGSDAINLKVKILLLTASGEKKFMATLRGTGVPFTARNLLGMWLRYPVVLFLTSARIIYESFKLHMGRPRLNVYPRPEPAFDPQFAATKGPNPIQQGATIGATGWQKPDWRTKWAQNILVDYLTRRVAESHHDIVPLHPSNPTTTLSSSAEKEVSSLGSFVDLGTSSHDDDDDDDEISEDDMDRKNMQQDSSGGHITVVLQPADRTQETIVISPPHAPNEHDSVGSETLTIEYGSPSFFLDLLLYPTPSLAQLICEESEGTWKVSSVELFRRVFSEGTGAEGVYERGPVRLGRASGLLGRWINGLRSVYFRWLLAFIPAHESHTGPLRRRASWFPPPHFVPIHEPFTAPRSSPLDLPSLHASNHATSLRICLLLAHSIVAQLVYYWLFNRLLRFRFVHPTHPWLVLKRAVFHANRIPLSPSSHG